MWFCQNPSHSYESLFRGGLPPCFSSHDNICSAPWGSGGVVCSSVQTCGGSVCSQKPCALLPRWRGSAPENWRVSVCVVIRNTVISVLLNQKSSCYVWIIISYAKLKKSNKSLCFVAPISPLGGIFLKQALHECWRERCLRFIHF